MAVANDEPEPAMAAEAVVVELGDAHEGSVAARTTMNRCFIA